MHIKEVCLEGFKSYAGRTVVSGFDPLFNAITGLNGSGKSNILDSICFVLGITDLRQVRAASLQELVYKQGQAGVTKATVSIVFDNSDRSRSPLGYEDSPEITVTRQIVVGGRNKYLINGHLAQPSRVQTLFHSVQLNVNNPHFLIMQGRITKVLNMKPPEILSMLEEAAGTRMYEMKKESALKTLEKKENKVDEINKLLDDEILPALAKLRKERCQYMKWANGNAELDRLKRFCIAYEFVQAERVRDGALNDVKQIRAKIVELDESAEKLKAAVQEMDTNISTLAAVKEAKQGGEMKALSEKVDRLSHVLIKETSVMNNQEETLKSEEKGAEKILANIEDIKRSILERDAAVKKIEDDAFDMKKRAEDLTKELDENEKEYQGVLAGKSSANEKKCLEDQLRDARAEVGEAQSGLKNLTAKISHSEKELKEKKAQLVSKRDEATAAENELKARTKDLEALKTSMGSINYKEGQMEVLQKDRSTELGLIQGLKDTVRKLSAELANVDFRYRDPVRGFDRSKVKGVFARLVRIKDTSAALALEVAAEGKLFNVVVDTDATGKQLLQNGDLRRRVTIILLNKIQTKMIPDRVQQAARRLVGADNVTLALELVGYDEEVKNAVAYVFGSAFVCRNIEAAKEVTFNRDIGQTSVTLQGDTYKANGLLTGGDRSARIAVLQKLDELAKAESDLTVHEERLSSIEQKIAALLPLQKKYTELKSQFELKSYDLSLFQNRVEQNEHHKLGELVKKIEQELHESKQELSEKKELYEKCVNRVSELEKIIKTYGTEREGRLKALEKNIKSLKSEMQSMSKQLKAHESERERMIMEKDAVANELVTLEEQLSTSRAQITVLSEALDKQKDKVASIKQEYDQVECELNAERSKLKECDSQINRMTKEQQILQQQLSDSNVDRKKMENEVKRMEIEQKDCSLRVEKLMEKYSWIATEKQLFGKSGTDYDFASCEPHKAREELDNLQAQQSSLEKRVNKKVMAMFEKAEDEYNDLMSKKNIIENELDEKKKETLKVTWLKVNKDFGSIFSTLLPGTMAKLDPPEGGTFLDGLEVRVAFGTVWKQSLSELSGGQRSLLALSLILALLLFKPAPLYILDEVDAALDLSHTQNIGRMIKAHFPHSQFIVVSLKEGMFNNANVIFRTKFIDGVSTVTRTVPSKQR
ncbi:hypothetical protein PR202_ga08594 [Eleusine coracana subsp. coracana]|uniref:SMC hinge domain-containing protein n=1 Tax=Eleusine coracana subsp. coracana TaxID=191504 RepID=A0AAV5C0E8_ELECO|nr:hypothetical protein PR202_ga08594 [Eleusine coracana subsp. coracana]